MQSSLAGERRRGGIVTAGHWSSFLERQGFVWRYGMRNVGNEGICFGWKTVLLSNSRGGSSRGMTQKVVDFLLLIIFSIVLPPILGLTPRIASNNPPCVTLTNKIIIHTLGETRSGSEKKGNTTRHTRARRSLS